VQLTLPTWKSRRISREVAQLQPFIFDNVFDPVAKPFPNLLFADFSDGPPVLSEPDFILSKNGNLQSLVEVKGKWCIPCEQNICYQYDTNQHVNSAVNQLYSYLVLNHRNSGILTNYEMTWFFERRIEENEEENLYVSEGVPYNRQDITLFQCMAFFITDVACDTDFKSPPSSRKASPRQLRKPTSQEMIKSPLSEVMSVDDINPGSKIGQGRTGNVFLADFNSTALKTLDISKRPHLVQEMLNEISIYSKLESLQGKIIPTYRYSGIVEGILFVLGLDYLGSVPNQLNTMQKAKILTGLSDIHSLGILHGDIRLENIVVDLLGNPFIIDFSLASLETNSQKFKEEFELMHSLLSSL
jgi:predicted Ser/Thr protein kinase